MQSFGVTVLVVVAVLFGPAGVPQAVADLSDGRAGRIAFAAKDVFSFADALGSTPSSQPITLTGELILPPGGPERMPAMVIVPGHLGDGAGGREQYWVDVFLKLNIATFVVDSFGPRGLDRASDDHIHLTGAMMTADALAALDELATHPRLDPSRIGVLGFSQGGFAAVNSAIAAVQARIGDGTHRFAVHLAFYPPCNAQWYTAVTTGAPIAFFLAENDDLTLARHCENYAERIAAAGGKVTTTVFPGAVHGFDGDLPLAKRASIFNASKCMYRINDQGVMFDVNNSNLELTSPDRRRESFARCGYFGAMTGGSDAARTAATAKVRALMAETLLQP